MMPKFYSVRRRPIDENNDIVNKSWIVYRHGYVAKLTSVAVFTAAEDLAIEYLPFLRNAVMGFLRRPAYSNLRKTVFLPKYRITLIL